MKLLFLFFALNLVVAASFGQTCTLSATGTINWNNASPPACAEGGTAIGASVINIPEGLTLVFDDNVDTWTGVLINVFGTLTISAPGQVTINATIQIKSGGTVNINSKLVLGSEPECGYTVDIETGGLLDIIGGTAERLIICGEELVRGGTAGCNSYPQGPPPYCEPSGGFSGPVVITPVTWLWFKVQNIDNKSALLSWATASEKNSEKFIIERSPNGKNFQEVESHSAAGDSNEKIEYQVTDPHPTLGRNYYRLKQIDFDGTYSYSEIRFVDITGKKAISVYPNPLEDDQINIRANFASEDVAYASLIDLTGMVIEKFSFQGTEFKRTISLPAGSYLIKITFGKEQFISRFVVR